MIRKHWVRWALGVALASFMVVGPYVYYRFAYTYQKRLRVVTPGKVYRSGCMTAIGLEQAIKQHKIRTVINLMEEAPDPLLKPHLFAAASVKESELVAKAGARYVPMTVTYLPRNKARTERPETIERYLEILDDPNAYPVLVHCKAGLHRTGVLIALYRMEYEGWSKGDALQELKAMGFGEFASTSANEYVQQYVLSYQPHLRRGLSIDRARRRRRGISCRDRGRRRRCRRINVAISLREMNPLAEREVYFGDKNEMFTVLDRQLTWSFLKAYLVCLVSLLGMYVVIDLFMNLDDFTQNSNFAESMEYIGAYYTCKVTQIFDRLSEPVALLAAMFTIAWMQRNNELLPLLSAGVSTRRVVRPVLVAAFCTLALSVVNQEVILPQVDSYMVEHRGDREGDRETPVKAAFDANGFHLSGRAAFKKEMLVKDFTVVIAQQQGEGIMNLQAKEARYVPQEENRPHSGGWKLTQTTPAEIEGRQPVGGVELIVPGEYFVKTKYVDFDVLTRSKSWYVYVPTHQLIHDIGRIDSTQLASVAVVFHMRLTRPVLGMLLVFMGLSVILRDQNRNVFISAGMCLVLCAAFFGILFACKYLGDYEHLSPALAAWLPVLGFGPLSFVMFDAVHT